jgi:hypothetical protein
MPRSSRNLPASELDTVPEFCARANVSVRTGWRKIADGTLEPAIVRINDAVRIDPARGMQALRGELPPPPVPRRGRPRTRS